MKKILVMIAIAFSIVTLTSNLKADNDKSVVSKITNYRKQSASNRKPNFSFVDEGLKLLNTALQQKNRNAELNEQIVLLTVLLLKTDPAQDAVELFHPFYKKEQKDFMPAINKLSKQDRNILETAIKNFEISEEEGNG